MIKIKMREVKEEDSFAPAFNLLRSRQKFLRDLNLPKVAEAMEIR